MTKDATLAPPTPKSSVRHLQETAALEHSLAFGLRLVGAAEAFAAQFAAPELGDIDLPPALSSAADQANLRAVAPLYLASELEAARLLPAVETMAGLFISGGLSSDLGPAAEPLTRFWRARRDRLSVTERRAIFSRLFGRKEGPAVAAEGGANAAFEELLLNLVEALTEVNESRFQTGESSAGIQVRIRTASAALAGNLAPRSQGATGLMARDLLETLQAAINIIKVPEVQRAVHATSLWTAVGNLAAAYLGESPDIGSHVDRGRAGQSILAWLASRLPELESTTPAMVGPNDPVVAAAHTWIEASLALLKPEPRAPSAA